MPAPTVAQARPMPMRMFVGSTGAVSRWVRRRTHAVAAASRPVTPSTAANHIGRVSHHPEENRTGAHTPAASAAAQSASADRCHDVHRDRCFARPVEQPSPARCESIESAGDDHQHAHLCHAGHGGEQSGWGGVRPLALDGVDQGRVISADVHQPECAHRRDRNQHRPRTSLVLPPGLPSQPPPRADQPGHAPRQEEAGPTDGVGRPESEPSEVERSEDGEAGADCRHGVLGQCRDVRTQSGQRHVHGEEPQGLRGDARAVGHHAPFASDHELDDAHRRPQDDDDGAEPDEGAQPGCSRSRCRRGVGPTGGREEHGHRRQHREPGQPGMECDRVGAPDRAVRTTVDDGEREVTEHHQHQGADTSDVDGAPTS